MVLVHDCTFSGLALTYSNKLQASLQFSTITGPSSLQFLHDLYELSQMVKITMGRKLHYRPDHTETCPYRCGRLGNVCLGILMGIFETSLEMWCALHYDI